MLRLALLLGSCGLFSAWHTDWDANRPSWYEAKPHDFPLSPDKIKIMNYQWGEEYQRAQVETTKGAVYFRRYIPQEVFASQLAEYLGICVAKARRVPWNSEVSHKWQDRLSDVHHTISEDLRMKTEYLFEDQTGLQEVEFIDGALLQGFSAKGGYDDIMFDIGKLFAFDMFINDPHNCRFCMCGQADSKQWTCKDGDQWNFIISPTRGVCGHTRAYSRLDIDSDRGLKFRQFFQIAQNVDSSTELSRQLAYVVGDMFGENLSVDRRQAAEKMLEGARFALHRILELNGDVFHMLVKTSGLHDSFEFGLGERLRMVRIILGERTDKAEQENLQYIGQALPDKRGLGGEHGFSRSENPVGKTFEMVEESATKTKNQAKGSLSPL